MGILTILGAYGRVYHTTDRMLVAWRAGKDFKILNGPYCSIRDIDSLTKDYTIVQLMAADGGTVAVGGKNPTPQLA